MLLKPTIQKKSPRKAAVTIIVTIITVLGLLASFGTGLLQYAAATIYCLKPPVAASRFMAAYTYELPGERGYGPSPFNEYFCSEQDAKSAGFRHSTLTDAGKAEEEARWQEYEATKKFAPSKINFTLYVPRTDTFAMTEVELSAMGGYDNQAFFTVKKDGSHIARIREGKAPNKYELCNNEDAVCSTIGNDAAGRPIKKQVIQSGRDQFVSYAITIGDTFINIESAHNINDETATAIFSSMQAYTQE